MAGWAGLVTMLALAAPPASAQSYTFRTVNYRAGLATYIEGINAAGTVVGNYVDKNGNEHCFTRTGGKRIVISMSDTVQTTCYGINAAGALAVAVSSNTFTGAFLYANGVFTPVVPPDSQTNGAVAYGVNDSGAVIGTFEDSAQAQHGFIFSGGHYTVFDVPGAAATLGIGINNAGQYTAQAYDAAGNISAWLNTGGGWVGLNFPSAAATDAHGINTHGQVALGWVDTAGNTHGGVYNGAIGIYYTLDYPGATYTEIRGINDRETIVGSYALPGASAFAGFSAVGRLPKKP